VVLRLLGDILAAATIAKNGPDNEDGCDAADNDGAN
jgi:hypothetical protein